MGHLGGGGWDVGGGQGRLMVTLWPGNIFLTERVFLYTCWLIKIKLEKNGEKVVWLRLGCQRVAESGFRPGPS